MNAAPMVSKRDASVLSQTFREADRLRRVALDGGATATDADAIVTQALMQAWPKGREAPWVYLCGDCEDTGWRHQSCDGDATCGRPAVHRPHAFVTHCWCAAGVRMTPKPPNEADELATLGRTKQPSTFARFGR